MHLAAEELLAHEFSNTSVATGSESAAVLIPPSELASIVSKFATSDGWMDRVQLRTEQRWYERLYQGPDYDIWVISWLPGQSTGFHDHGNSAGAFVLATGILEEHRPGAQPIAIYPGQTRAFGLEYAHDVRNVSLAPAISIHAYSPPLTDMNEFELEGNQLVPRGKASERAETLNQERRIQSPKSIERSGVSGIEQMLLTARARLRRLSPSEGHDASGTRSAVLVDIRPEGQRAIEGTIPGALIVERNVLEWRFDPTSTARLPVAKDHDIQVIVFCSEGYTSSLAATALQDLGLWRATDIVGGFHAWRAAGLPTIPPSEA